MTRLAALALTGLLASTSPALALNAPVARAAIDAQLTKSYPGLDALYRQIHAHPELAFQEKATAARLAKEMRALGFEVTEGVATTGLVAIYHNGPGPTVLVRTELDALPMEEKTGLPWASKAIQDWNGKPSPVAHSCGHDIHMAAWVGTAQALVAMKDRWHGTLMFIGQPAEESTGGAKAMVAEGIFSKFGKPDYGFALHVGGGPTGEVTWRAGATTSNSDSLDILFKGKGGHGSMPATTIDPIMEEARFIVDVQSVISREKDPAAFGVITIGAIQAGSAGNIIPDRALLRGTIRSHEASVRVKLHDGIKRTANAVAAMAGAPAPEVTITPGGQAVINDTALADRTGAIFRAAFGQNAQLQLAPSSASEDYSEFIIAGVPSLFFGIGGYEPAQLKAAAARGETLASNHSPQFAPVAEPAIRTGVEAMTLAVLGVLGR